MQLYILIYIPFFFLFSSLLLAVDYHKLQHSSHVLNGKINTQQLLKFSQDYPLSNIKYTEYNITFEENIKPHLVIETEELPVIPFKMDERYETIYTETAYLQVFAVATIGIIASFPESVSKWSKEDKEVADAQELFNKHAKNVAAGPIIDDDEWAINYIGHPVTGAYYYVWGRQSGLTWQESTILSALMSTFFWEYGWESFAEMPSIQDLITTPLLGALLGEGTNYLYNHVMANDGKIYDSIFLGDIARGLLNPIGELNQYFKNFLDSQNIEIAVDYSYNQNITNFNTNATYEYDRFNQTYFGLDFYFKY